MIYLHRGVAPASKLEGGCEDGVEVAAAGGERRAHHRGGDEAVDGRCVPSGYSKLSKRRIGEGGEYIAFGIGDCQILLRIFKSNKTRSKTTDEGGNSFDDRAVQNGYGQVRRAHLRQTLEHNRHQVEMLLSLTFLHCKLRSGSDQHGSRRFRDPKEFESPCKEEFLAWIKQNHISNRRLGNLKTAIPPRV